MKKSVLVAAIALTMCGSAMAQEQQSSEDRAKMRAEMVQKQAERFAKDFELKDDAKTNFIATFTEYQNALMGTMEEQKAPEQEKENADKKKDLTDEEATAKIQESFDRQSKAIETMQNRLDIQKKYYAEFAKTLTPKQLVKIFARQRRGGQPGGQQGGDNQQRGGFGGPGGGPRGGFGGPGGGPGGF